MDGCSSCLAALIFAQPRSGFWSLGGEGGLLSDVWFWLGIYVLLGLVFGALCSQGALRAGRRASRWFAIGFFASILGYVALRVLPQNPPDSPEGIPGGLRKMASTFAPQACPHCGAMNHPAAAICLNCGAQLSPRFSSEAALAARRSR